MEPTPPRCLPEALGTRQSLVPRLRGFGGRPASPARRGEQVGSDRWNRRTTVSVGYCGVEARNLLLCFLDGFAQALGEAGLLPLLGYRNNLKCIVVLLKLYPETIEEHLLTK